MVWLSVRGRCGRGGRDTLGHRLLREQARHILHPLYNIGGGDGPDIAIRVGPPQAEDIEIRATHPHAVADTFARKIRLTSRIRVRKHERQERKARTGEEEGEDRGTERALPRRLPRSHIPPAPSPLPEGGSALYSGIPALSGDEPAGNPLHAAGGGPHTQHEQGLQRGRQRRQQRPARILPAMPGEDLRRILRQLEDRVQIPREGHEGMD